MRKSIKKENDRLDKEYKKMYPFLYDQGYEFQTNTLKSSIKIQENQDIGLASEVMNSFDGKQKAIFVKPIK